MLIHLQVTAIIVASSILFLLAGVLLYRISQLKLTIKCLLLDVSSLHTELRLLLNADKGLGKRLHAIEAAFNNLEYRQEQLEYQDRNDDAYPRAVKLVEKGASLDEIIETCSLNRAEAELLIHLYQNKRVKVQVKGSSEDKREALNWD